MGKLTVEQALLRARSHEKKGEIAQARAVLTEAQAAYPGNARVRQAAAALAASPAANPPGDRMQMLLGLFRQGNLPQAIALAETLARSHPASYVVWNLLGAALAQSGRTAPAVDAFRRAVALDPGQPDGARNLGRALLTLDRPDEALTVLAGVTRLRPDDAEAHNLTGSALMALRRTDEAVDCFGRALALRPDYPDALNNHGNALLTQGQAEQAEGQFLRALAIQPDHVQALNNLGNALVEQGRHAEAVTAYSRALAVRPDDGDALANLGAAQTALGRANEALATLNRAVEVAPRLALAHFNMGNLMVDRNQHEVAVAAYRQVLALQPDHVAAEAKMRSQMQHLCDWTEPGAAARLGVETGAITPFGLLAVEDDPARQLIRARKWAAEKFRIVSSYQPARPATRPARLRLGYFGADFHDHATMYLMSGLLREHDRSAFEVIIYSYGQTRTGEMRERAQTSVDAFHDVAGWPDRQIVELAHQHALDIAVDLKGYTLDSRSGLFQHRLAPVQVNWLGYPGTMGADFIDYMLADPVVIPADERPHVSEHVIRLPHSYQPNDDRRPIAGTGGTRADHDLPDGAFVFCCFNNTWKLGPAEFSIWMRLLDAVPGSVLWLFRSNDRAEVNLRAEAERRGVDAARLVFAPNLPHADHLARLRHADLFLDTFAYNAHTTASDALWAGVPLVTRQGRSFAARVASSLLTAVDLPDLITQDEAGYEALALALARDPARLAELRNRLAANRTTAPLFDSRRFARAFESGLRQAWERWFDGLPPDDIDVTVG